MDDLQAFFKQALHSEIQALRAAAGDLHGAAGSAVDAIHDVAHRLKGSAASYGFPEITDAAIAVLAANGPVLSGRVRSLVALLEHTAVQAPVEKRIVLVEDDPLIQRLFGQVLGAPGREVVLAGSLDAGRDAIDAGETSLVLLDLFLPDGDGRMLLRELRSLPEFASLPVVVLSGSDSDLVRAECLALGADAYVEKSSDPDFLKRLVTALLHKADEVQALEHVLDQAGALRYFEEARDGADAFVMSVVRAGSTDTVPLAERLVSELGTESRVAIWTDDELIAFMPDIEVSAGAALLETALASVSIGAATRARAAVIDSQVGPSLADAVDAAIRGLDTADGGVVVVTREAQPGPRTILLADDDAIAAALVVHRLKREGYQVRHCADGQEALDAAIAERHDLVILDVKMPRMGGFELLGRLRERSEYAAVPIVMLTAMGNEREVVRGFELGADDYILKPFSPAELVIRVDRLVTT